MNSDQIGTGEQKLYSTWLGLPLWLRIVLGTAALVGLLALLVLSGAPALD